MNPEPEELGVQLESASSWQLTWRRFRRHKLAVVSLILLGFLYLVVLLADFVATADPNRIDASRAYLPPPTHPPEGRQRIQPPCAPGVRGVGPQHFPKGPSHRSGSEAPGPPAGPRLRIRLSGSGFDRSSPRRRGRWNPGPGVAGDGRAGARPLLPPGPRHPDLIDHRSGWSRPELGPRVVLGESPGSTEARSTP